MCLKTRLGRNCRMFGERLQHCLLGSVLGICSFLRMAMAAAYTGARRAAPVRKTFVLAALHLQIRSCSRVADSVSRVVAAGIIRSHFELGRLLEPPRRSAWLVLSIPDLFFQPVSMGCEIVPACKITMIRWPNMNAKNAHIHNEVPQSRPVKSAQQPGQPGNCTGFQMARPVSTERIPNPITVV